MFVLFLRLLALGLTIMSLALEAVFVLRPAAPRPLLSATRTTVNQALWLRDLDSGRDWRVPTTFTTALGITWSPDNRLLTYNSLLFVFTDVTTGRNAYSVNIYDLAAGRNRRIGDSGAAPAQPVWSPDGRWLIFDNQSQAGNGLHYVEVTPESIGATRFLSPGFPDVLWSPDGARLVFRLVSGRSRLASFPASCLSAGDCKDRGREIELDTPVTGLIAWPVGDNAIMALSAPPPGEPMRLLRADLSTGKTATVLDHILPGALPAWSPDGDILAAALVKPDDFGIFLAPMERPGLYLIDRANNAERIYEGVAGQFSWTPQGDRLVYETFDPDTLARSLRLYDRATGETHIVGAPGTLETQPTWGTFTGRYFALWPLPAGAILLVIFIWNAGRRFR